MAGPKKTLHHGELVRMGEVEVLVDSDPIESNYKRGTYFVALKINGVERTYSPVLRSCTERFRGYKGKTVRILATGSDYEGATDADVEIIGAAQQSQRAPQQSNQQGGQQQQRRNDKMPINGQTVGMAINNACQFLLAAGKELTAANIFPIASEIIRISRYMEAGNLAPKASDSNRKSAPPPPQQRAPEPPPQEPPPSEDDDVPWAD